MIIITRNEKEITTTDTEEVTNISREYCEKFYANKLGTSLLNM